MAAALYSHTMELFSRRRWTTGLAQQSNMYGNVLHLLHYFGGFDTSSLPLGPIQPSSHTSKELHGHTIGNFLVTWCWTLKLPSKIASKIDYRSLGQSHLWLMQILTIIGCMQWWWWSSVHPDFHWPNIFSTVFCEFHWRVQKCDNFPASSTDQEVN